MVRKTKFQTKTGSPVFPMMIRMARDTLASNMLSTLVALVGQCWESKNMRLTRKRFKK